MSLKASATSTCSVDPVGVGARARSPAAIWRAVAREAAQRTRERARDRPGEAEAEREDDGAEREQGQRCRGGPRLDRLDALGEADRAGRSAGVDDRHGREEQVLSSESLCRVPWEVRPSSAGAISGRLA